MNIIVNGFHEQYHINILEKLFSHYKINYCEYIHSRLIFDKSLATHVKFHDCNKLNNIKYFENIDFSKIPPLDENIIKAYQHTEVVILKMMDRLENFHTHLDYNERKALYLKHLRYWRYRVKEKKINLFISSNIPHEIYDYIIYSICKKENIKVIILFQLQINDTILAMDNWEKFNTNIEKNYQKLLTKEFTNEQLKLPQKFQNEFDKQTKENINAKPFYMQSENKSLLILKKLFSFERIKRFLSINRLLVKQKYISNEKKLFTFYNRHSITPDLTKKFIYLPLHYQPELTTCPLGGAFVDQILIANMISYYLSEDVFLYVKEHPKQRLRGRDIRLYKDLLKNKNTFLINKSFDSFLLIDKCLALATVSGTAGWEALFKEKPVLLFGNMFYQYAKGVFLIKTAEDCKNALYKIINKNFRPKLIDIKLFLKSLEESSIEGYIDSVYKIITKISYEDNINNIYNSLKTIIDKLELS